ncbi:hypothetical protein PS662_06105 [Pseudomonas fluorescens]|uniref:Uncharacterized protein n=1 Tax=Pseudomonas fluorescens TaxID=294 RepID=A0A5E6Y3I7_PSEFL|nr:hypothetical protein PS662_06105 [Pseudomonas fluorescens]
MPGGLRQPHIDLDGFTQCPLQQFAQAFEDLARVADRRRQRLATGEGEQLRRQFCPAFHCRNRRRDPTLHVGIVRLMPRQQMQVAGDHLQQVIEVMGHATGKAADGFEFLRLAQLFFRRQPRTDFIGNALFQVTGELEQGFFGGLAFVDVDQHAGKAERLALFIELAAAAGLYPQVTAIRAQHPVLGVEGLAGGHGLIDLFLDPVAVVRVNPRFGEFGWQVAEVAFGRIGEGAGKALIAGQQIALDVPHERAEQSPGIQRQAHSFIVGAIGVFGLLAPALGDHMVGGFDHHRHDPGRLAAVIGHRAVIEVKPDILGNAVAQQHQFFIVIGQGAAGQTGIDHVPVEFGDFRPAQFHRRAQQIRVSASGER